MELMIVSAFFSVVVSVASRMLFGSVSRFITVIISFIHVSYLNLIEHIRFCTYFFKKGIRPVIRPE
jgi:hypothetical protein